MKYLLLALSALIFFLAPQQAAAKSIYIDNEKIDRWMDITHEGSYDSKDKQFLIDLLYAETFKYENKQYLFQRIAIDSQENPKFCNFLSKTLMDVVSGDSETFWSIHATPNRTLVTYAGLEDACPQVSSGAESVHRTSKTWTSKRFVSFISHGASGPFVGNNDE